MTSPAGFGDVTEALWRKFRPLIDERIATIERAIESQSPGDRIEATRAAHSLAGALGSYGRDEASAVARDLERRFSTGDDAGILLLAAELRRLVAL